MSTFTKASEEYTHRSQSWIFNGVYRNNSGMYEVEVRKNAYADQSWAKVSVWGRDGWNLFVELPVEEWYDDLPSYTKSTLSRDDKVFFEDVRRRLLQKLALAMWNATEDVTLTGEAA